MSCLNVFHLQIDDAPYAVSALTILIELHAVAVVLAIVMAVCSALV